MRKINLIKYFHNNLVIPIKNNLIFLKEKQIILQKCINKTICLRIILPFL